MCIRDRICTGKKLIHQLCNIRQLADLHSTCISQQVVERFIEMCIRDSYRNSQMGSF